VLYVEMACNGMFGLTEGIKPPNEDRYFVLKEVSLAVPNVTVTQVRLPWPWNLVVGRQLYD
jgi:hypothetical protein